MWNLDYVIRDVDDMYKYAQANNLTLLPNSVYDFWNDYILDSDQYDRLFRRMYINYKYFDQNISDNNPVSRVLQDFKDAVDDLFLMNHDKYDELYKIKLASLDIDISPFNDYKMTETGTGTDGYTKDYTFGEREDESSRLTPPLTTTTTNEKMAYDSNSFINDSKSTTSSLGYTILSDFTKGEQTDIEHKTGTSVTNKSTTGVRNNPYDNLSKANKYWDTYDLYKKIFADICKELLLVK